MNLKLWVDDLRPAPTENWFVAKNVNEAVSTLLDVEDFTIVSLDHDLADFHPIGDDQLIELTGMDILFFMEEKGIWPEKLYIHSANVVAVKRMKNFVVDCGPYRQMNISRGGIIFFWDKGEEK